MLLVGGASTRFGSPKALARLGDETFAERAWRLLGEACSERIAVGKGEYELPFEVLDDGTDVRAPIAGIVGPNLIAALPAVSWPTRAATRRFRGPARFPVRTAAARCRYSRPPSPRGV